MVQLGDTMTLKCRVTGDPIPKVKWMRGETLEHLHETDDDSKMYVIPVDGNKYIVREDGTLVVTDMTEQDVGMYECVASSDMGSAKSRKVRTIITAAPSASFVEKPRSQNVTAGTDVTFTCQVTGNPKPDVRWSRDGRTVSLTGRISLEQDGSQLRIVAVKKTDAGRYGCDYRSVDQHGFAFADLGVDVSAAPQLLFKPQDMEAELDATIEIPCRAEGTPKPLIQWKKDGSALENERRFRITRGGSLLIFRVTAQDTGR